MFVDGVGIVIVGFWMVGDRRLDEEEGGEGRGDDKGPAWESRAENIIVVVRRSERSGCMMLLIGIFDFFGIAVFRALQR